MRIAVFSHPLMFRIKVPKNAQPTFSNRDFVPSETYLVYWDGEVLSACWEQKVKDRIPSAGGHVAMEILGDAVRNLGGELYIQACSPGCLHKFVHATMLVRTDPKAHEFSVRRTGVWSSDCEVVVPGDWDFQRVAREFYRYLRGPLHYFAEVKNLGRRILDVHHRTWHDLEDLVQIQYTQARIHALGPWNRVKKRWKLRGWRKQSQLHLSELWIALTVLDMLRSRWRDRKLRFDEATAETRTQVVFERDYANDASAIEGLDLDLIRAGVEHASSRLDTRAVVWASVLGTVGGAVAGALITLV
jgi:hypothetical protein